MLTWAERITLIEWRLGSWSSLPRLGPRLQDGFYSVVPPPHNDDWKVRWRTLTEIGQGDVPVVPNAHSVHPAEPAPPSRASTPPAQIFSISDEVLRMMHDTRLKFDEIVLIKGQMQERARSHTHRSQAAKNRGTGNDDLANDVNNVGSEDVSLLWASISEVNLMLVRIFEAFENIPAMPANWTAVLDLLTQIGELRELYKVSWERFVSLEEDVRPLRTEMQRVRYRIAEVQERVDQISNEAIMACEPLIHNLYSQLDTQLTHLEQGQPSPLPHVTQMGDVLKALTWLSERVDQLERAAEADDFRTRIDGYISRYLADRGLADHILRQLGTASAQTPSSWSAGSSVSHVLHTVYTGQAPSSNVAPGISENIPVVPPLSLPPGTIAAQGAAVRAPAAPLSTVQHERPVDRQITSVKASSSAEMVGQSMVSRMHKRSYGRGSSSARNGG